MYVCVVCRLQVLQRPLTKPDITSPSHFWRCCYGNHPRSIILTEHSGVSLGDFRVSEVRKATFHEKDFVNTCTCTCAPPTRF